MTAESAKSPSGVDLTPTRNPAPTVYLTSTGERVHLVWQGPEDPAEGPMQVLRNTDGQVRVAHARLNDYSWADVETLTVAEKQFGGRL